MQPGTGEQHYNQPCERDGVRHGRPLAPVPHHGEGDDGRKDGRGRYELSRSGYLISPQAREHGEEGGGGHGQRQGDLTGHCGQQARPGTGPAAGQIGQRATPVFQR